MHLRAVFAALWLADFTHAKPIANPPPLHFRQVDVETVTTTLTSTSTGTTANSDIYPAPLCIVTISVTPDEICSAVAQQYGIPLSTFEAQSLAGSDDCRYLLEGYRVCVNIHMSSDSSVLSSRSTLSTTTAASEPVTPTLTAGSASPTSSSTSHGSETTADAVFVTSDRRSLITTSSISSSLEVTADPESFVTSSTGRSSLLTSSSHTSPSLGVTENPASFTTGSTSQSSDSPSSSSSRVIDLTKTMRPSTSRDGSHLTRVSTMSRSSTETVGATHLSSAASLDDQTRGDRTLTVTITTCSKKSIFSAPRNGTVQSTGSYSRNSIHIPTSANSSFQHFTLRSSAQRTSIQSKLKPVSLTQETGTKRTFITRKVADTMTILLPQISLAARSIDIDHPLRPAPPAGYSHSRNLQLHDPKSTSRSVFSSTTATTKSHIIPLGRPSSTPPLASISQDTVSDQPLSVRSSSAPSELVAPDPVTISTSTSTILTTSSTSTSTVLATSSTSTSTISITSSASTRTISTTIATSNAESTSGRDTSASSVSSSPITESFSLIISSTSSFQTTSIASELPVPNTGLTSLSSSTEPAQATSTKTLAASSSTSADLQTTSIQSSPSTQRIISNSTTTVSDSSTACLAARAVAPAPTQTGIVVGCSLFYVAQLGDDCSNVAGGFNISVDTFITWNPAVGLDCSSLMTNDAYCVEVCGSVSTSIVFASTLTDTTTSLETFSSTLTEPSTTLTTAFSTSASALISTVSTILTSALPTSTASGVDVYRTYTGNGSAAAGWPSMDQWVSFDYMFDTNRPNMQASCAQWGVPDDSDTEVSEMRSAIVSIASDSGVDPRFILAIIMQESTGCVRVITTAYSVFNPGLMQSHNGTGTCNTNSASLLVVADTGVVQTPCPASEIRQMITDGVEGTSSGDGLQQILVEQGHTDVSKWYRAARMYNGGSIAASGDLGEGCCTLCYASDIANRLTGWVNAEHSCTL